MKFKLDVKTSREKRAQMMQDHSVGELHSTPRQNSINRSDPRGHLSKIHMEISLSPKIEGFCLVASNGQT
jgi:hypothetical protein